MTAAPPLAGGQLARWGRSPASPDPFLGSGAPRFGGGADKVRVSDKKRGAPLPRGEWEAPVLGKLSDSEKWRSPATSYCL